MNSSNIILVLWFLICLACNSNRSNSKKIIDVDPALDVINQSILDHPGTDSLYYNRAQYYLSQLNYDLAIKDLLYLVDRSPDIPVYHHSLADAYLDKGDSYQALKTMEDATNQLKERIPTLLKLCEFQNILKQFDASIKTCLQILEKDPLNAEAYLMTGINYRDLLDTLNAIKSFEKATAYNDRLIDAWILLGQLNKYKKPKYALQCLQNAYSLDTNSVTTMHALAEYFESENRHQAIQYYEKAIHINTNYLPAYQNLGMLFFSVDSMSQALMHFDILCQKDPSVAQYRYFRGIVLEAIGKNKEALADYQSSLNLEPENKDYKLAIEKLKSTLK